MKKVATKSPFGEKNPTDRSSAIGAGTLPHLPAMHLRRGCEHHDSSKRRLRRRGTFPYTTPMVRKKAPHPLTKSLFVRCVIMSGVEEDRVGCQSGYCRFPGERSCGPRQAAQRAL